MKSIFLDRLHCEILLNLHLPFFDADRKGIMLRAVSARVRSKDQLGFCRAEQRLMRCSDDDLRDFLEVITTDVFLDF